METWQLLADCEFKNRFVPLIQNNLCLSFLSKIVPNNNQMHHYC